MNITSVNFLNLNPTANCGKPKPCNHFNGFNNLKPLAQDTVSFSGNTDPTNPMIKTIVKNGDYADVLEELGFDVVVDSETGKLNVFEYGQPDENHTFADYGINEQKLFDSIGKFEGETNLKNSKVKRVKDQEFEFLNIADKSIKEFDLGNAKIETLAINPQQTTKLKFKDAQIENLYIVENENVAENLGKLIKHVDGEVTYFPDEETVCELRQKNN